MSQYAPPALSESDQDCEQLATLFNILSERGRLEILMLLAQGDRNVTSLCDELQLVLAKASQHLAPLRSFNIVACGHDGPHRIYRLVGPGTSGHHILELSVQRLVVRILPKSKG